MNVTTHRPRVAVIGAGISGISAAWHLSEAGAQVSLLEKSPRLGGHTHTHTIATAEGEVAIDTGFIVFNRHNYPGFCAWLDRLGVQSKPSDMSFAVSDQAANFEYGTASIGAMIANPRQLLRAEYWRLWADVVRFYRAMAIGDVADTTLGAYLELHRYSKAFAQSHIVPMCAALWSQPAGASLDLSLRHVIEFLRNHRMLQLKARPRWRVVDGGSSSYVKVFAERFRGTIQTACSAVRVCRNNATPTVYVNGTPQAYDAVVLACHSGEALATLAQPTRLERQVLTQFPYQANAVYLHSDEAFMPVNKRCWSSWNVRRGVDDTLTVTYWMNRLQGLTCKEQFFVTLNPQRQPVPVHWQGAYQHPRFTRDSKAAQARWREVSTGCTAFAGAYWDTGFHEGGFVSGQRSAERLLSTVPHAA